MTDDQVPEFNGDTESDPLPVSKPPPIAPQAAPVDVEDVGVMRMGILVEGGIVVLALVLAWLFDFFDSAQPLASLNIEQWKTGAIWGTIGTLPLLLYMAVFIACPPRFLQPMRQFVDAQLRPLFANLSLLEILIIATMAGFCEELFFRWCLQGGLTGVTGSVIFGLFVASAVFGLCHWVNASYGITTAIVGLYLGLMMVWTKTWLAPAIAHALFDFVALIYIARVQSVE